MRPPIRDGIAQTFLVMGLIYAVFMSVGWLLIRVPAPGPDGGPAGWRHAKTGTLITTANVSARSAIRTPQFWLLWVVLCFNVTAGIGILERAAPIYSDFFPDATRPQALAAAAAGFVAMLSLANSVGRILWSSTSDFLGRKNMYRIYLGVGALLYLALTLLTNTNKVLFLLIAILLLSFYGAGFATVPAYLRDLFGTYQVGAIHARLLTAWSTAGVLGPVIVNAIADARIAAGVAGPGRYTASFTIMVGLLVVGFVCNELIRPVSERYHEPALEGRPRRGRRRADEYAHGHADRQADLPGVDGAGVAVGAGAVLLRAVSARDQDSGALRALSMRRRLWVGRVAPSACGHTSRQALAPCPAGAAVTCDV